MAFIDWLSDLNISNPTKIILCLEVREWRSLIDWVIWIFPAHQRLFYALRLENGVHWLTEWFEYFQPIKDYFMSRG